MTALSRLAAIHDKLTLGGFALAGVCLVVIACSFCYEIVSRYFFRSPTEWASPMVSYSMLAMIFLALPELTRRAEHININFLADSLSRPQARHLERLVLLIAACACLVAVWFSGSETLQQFNQDVWTSPPLAVPKWVVSIWVPYGMLGAATHFLRQLFARESVPHVQEAVL